MLIQRQCPLRTLITNYILKVFDRVLEATGPGLTALIGVLCGGTSATNLQPR